MHLNHFSTTYIHLLPNLPYQEVIMMFQTFDEAKTGQIFAVRNIFLAKSYGNDKVE